MYSFQFEIPTTSLILFLTAGLLVVLLIFIYLRPLWKIANRVAGSEKSELTPSGDVPVSVIIFASDEAEALRRLLPSILGQKYHAPFEVIVVNEGQSDSTAEIVERLKLIHDNLYLTYTPDGARQLSRKKLALMIGIKAARYPVIVHTTATGVIDSDEWLAHITEPFRNPEVEVVLGYSSIDSSEDKGFGKRSRIFNSVSDDVPWINAALAGKPYRGQELNLAYTREAFFRNRGFSHSLNLKYGDDDIFINEITSRDNTRVVLHPDSMVKRKAWNVKRSYRQLRSRYRFTGRFLPKTARLLQTLGSLLLWIISILSIVGAFLMLPNLLGVVIGAIIVFGVCITSVLLWRRTISSLTCKKLMFSLVPLIYGLPLSNAIAAFKSMRKRKYNYTWN